MLGNFTKKNIFSPADFFIIFFKINLFKGILYHHCVNSLDQDQARHFVGPDLDPMSGLILIQAVCKSHQQKTPTYKELKPDLY